MGKINLTLEKNGETQQYEFGTDMSGLLKASKQLRQLLKEKWNLTNCIGDDPRIVGFIKKQIETYNADPKNYKASVTETLSVAKDVTSASAKDIIHAGKQAVKNKILHPFKKDKEPS